MKLEAVVILNSFCDVQGGASRVAIDEAIGLTRIGVRVVFFGASGPISRELTDADVEVICLDQASLSSAKNNFAAITQGLWNQRAFQAMADLLQRFSSLNTIIHLHGFSHSLSSSPVRCAIDRNFKVVMTLHEYFAACPNGAFFDYRRQQLCPVRPLSFRCVSRNCDKRNYTHKLYRLARTLVQREIGKIPRGILNYVALSQGSGLLLRSYLPHDARVAFLRNPINIARHPRVPVENNSVILSIGRLDPEKGILQLLEAARLANVRIVHVGDGALRPLVEASGICKVTGWVSRERVLEYLEISRCLVFPSLWRETYGLCVDEASARGVPSIVSDITAAAERVVDGVTGWHTRADDPSDIAKKLTFIDDSRLVSTVGRAAYNTFWEQPPTNERHAQELFQMYENILTT